MVQEEKDRISTRIEEEAFGGVRRERVERFGRGRRRRWCRGGDGGRRGGCGVRGGFERRRRIGQDQGGEEQEEESSSGRRGRGRRLRGIGRALMTGGPSGRGMCQVCQGGGYEFFDGHLWASWGLLVRRCYSIEGASYYCLVLVHEDGSLWRLAQGIACQPFSRAIASFLRMNLSRTGINQFLPDVLLSKLQTICGFVLGDSKSVPEFIANASSYKRMKISYQCWVKFLGRLVPATMYNFRTRAEKCRQEN
mmetsp:Transcript_56226/g.168341  ORF Transcript_56226/g.168341 Transcript_56226/m.168341 type:complete len:251 (-) Transcript_56226:22-774(-)